MTNKINLPRRKLINKSSRASIKLLREHFGDVSRLMLTVHEQEPLAPVELARTRLKTKQTVRECRLCPLGSRGSGPVPFEVPNIAKPVRLVVVGDFPTMAGAAAGTAGRYDSGPSKFLRATINGCGQDPGELAYVRAVSCHPQDSDVRGLTSRNPTHDESRICRNNLRMQLDAIDCPYVLLVGEAPLKQWRPDLRIGVARGRLGILWNRYYVWPVYHPGSIMHQYSVQPVNDWALDILRFITVATENMGLAALSERCIKDGCEQSVYLYDTEGVAWCDLHAAKGLDRRAEGLRHWLGPPVTQRMF